MPGWCPKLVPNELQSDGVCPAFLAKKLDGLLHSRAASEGAGGMAAWPVWHLPYQYLGINAVSTTWLQIWY